MGKHQIICKYSLIFLFICGMIKIKAKAMLVDVYFQEGSENYHKKNF